MKWWSGEYHANGRKRFESEGGFTDEDEALLHGQDKLYEIRHGLHVAKRDGSLLMTDWLDTWLKSLDLAHLSKRAYKSSIKVHIRPYFGNKAVGDITILDVRAFKAQLQRTLGKENSRNAVMTVLGLVMDDAVDAGLRKSSPIERKRSRGRYVKKKRERKHAMPVEVVDQLARNANEVFGYPGYVMIWTMAMTGMRPGELFGLTREYGCPSWPGSDPRPDKEERDRYDEDVERYGAGEKLLPAIRVERQVQYEDGELGFYPPKYHSYRTLVVPPFLADMHVKLLESHDSQWVFPAIEGGCLAQTAFNTVYWRPVADGCDARGAWRHFPARPEIPAVRTFEGKRMYLIRHGHKEWLDEDGHPRYVVEARMGHELEGTEGTYSNLTPAMERSVMDSLQARWEKLQASTDLAPVEPRPAQVTVARLVREAVAGGAVGG
ncbi:MAG: site-specific integrase, partial [Kitasatospora sp.]|nr:site-specific integrase [Kitasatospora sp.]